MARLPPRRSGRDGRRPPRLGARDAAAGRRAPPPRLSRETLVALAPAGEHLLRAVSEVVAAALAAIEALPEETRARSRWSFRSAQAALDLVSRMALAGAERARRQARATLKAETAREILAALDARSSALDGSAAAALRTVRGAVASALGGGGTAGRAGSRSPRPRRHRRIPPVSLHRDDAGDE